jgi:hypothetical protein
MFQENVEKWGILSPPEPFWGGFCGQIVGKRVANVDNGISFFALRKLRHVFGIYFSGAAMVRSNAQWSPRLYTCTPAVC